MVPTFADIDLDTAELEDFDENDIVEYNDGKVGIVAAVKTSDFTWPGNGETVEASSDDPVYIVMRETGGSKPFTADELESMSEQEAFGDVDASTSKLSDAELGRVYYVVDNPRDLSELRDGLDQIRQREAELLDVPGVEDPGVGFDSWPDSWEKADEPARLIALDAWTSMGASFSGCVSEIGSKRICAAFKDEMMGTEKWRGGFDLAD